MRGGLEQIQVARPGYGAAGRCTRADIPSRALQFSSCASGCFPVCKVNFWGVSCSRDFPHAEQGWIFLQLLPGGEVVRRARGCCFSDSALEVLPAGPGLCP